ncbi:MAG: hypothetical protein JXM70_30345 [Pirellulales bacterium]|nr:hypothetical protein [Pirellulales bacterium]
MNDSRWQDNIAGNVLTLQIIVAAMVAGCTVLLAIAIIVAQQDGQADNAGQLPILTYISILFGVSALAASWIVPTVMTARTREAILKDTWQSPQGPNVSARMSELLAQCGDAGKLLMLFSTKTIIRSAVLEGATFFLLIVYIIEHSPISLFAAIVLMVFIAAGFPFRARAIRWIEDQLHILDQERQFSE